MTRPIPDFKTPYSQEVGRQAAHWLLRLQETEPTVAGDRQPTRDQAFLDWLAVSPQHVCAFLEFYDTYDRLGQIDPDQKIHVPTLLRQASIYPVGRRQPEGGEQPMRPMNHGGSPTGATRRTRLGWGIAAGIIGVAVLAGGWPLLPFNRAGASAVTYSTAVGERVTIPLEDGSTMTLNTASRVEVDFDEHVRRIHLLAGEVHIRVRHEGRRPFEVVSDSVTVSDLGTEFDVYHHAGGVRVFVIEGKVQVTYERGVSPGTSKIRADDSNRTSPRNQASALIPLNAGEEIEVATEPNSPSISHSVLTPQQIQNALAWKGGHLSFRGDLLRDEVQEFNRYNTRQLVIADPRIANYRTGGTFAVTDVDGFLYALHETWGIEVLPPPSGTRSSNTLRLGLTRGPQSSGTH
jgi:transmembrane sensor